MNYLEMQAAFKEYDEYVGALEEEYLLLRKEMRLISAYYPSEESKIARKALSRKELK